MNLRFLVAFVAVLALPATAAMASVNPQSRPGLYAQYYGNYVITPGHLIGIDRFVAPSGKNVVLYSDYRSGIVRRLFPVATGEFAMGPGFDVASPAKLKLRFVREANGKVSGISLLPSHGPASFAKRVPLTNEEVTFFDGKIRLAGTLMLPATRGPHPAIILLHGSGPLTRFSFGPYPHFFTSLGLAVLIYDKRGTGASTGSPVDLDASALWGGDSPGQKAALGRLTHYPENLENDALAAFRFLQNRKDINPKEIGFWGSSEGGMLATQVAARNHDVAFAINSSGFEGHLWETVLYQNEALLRGMEVPEGQIDKAIAYLKLWMKVARTGEDYNLLLKEREELRALGKPWLDLVGKSVPTLKEMRWDWDHVLSFNSLPALRHITCPILGLWGELDQETDARTAESNARTVLAESGDKDFTLKIIPNANHALQEMPARARMAPGVFATLRSWLLARVR